MLLDLLDQGIARHVEITPGPGRPARVDGARRQRRVGLRRAPGASCTTVKRRSALPHRSTTGRTLGPMEDERHLPGMPELHRQPVVEPPPPAGAPASPRFVPETRPTPLQRYYINLSAVALVCGFVAITALELGAPLGSPIVKVCVLIGAPLLFLTMADATLRIWRSAWAWMPVDRGRGLFRLAWVAVVAVLYVLLVVATALVLTA